MPPGRSRILYWPSESVTTVRTFSMRAGLDASTVTPGSTAPEVSRTTPAMALVPCALASADAPSTHAQTAVARSVKAARPDNARYITRRRRFVALPHPKALIVSPFAYPQPPTHERRLTVVGMCRRTDNLHPSRCQVDHEQRVMRHQPAAGPHLRR